MTEADNLREEIREIEGEIFRLRGSFNKADNGVKISRIATLNRTLDRLKYLAAAERARGGQA